MNNREPSSFWGIRTSPMCIHSKNALASLVETAVSAIFSGSEPHGMLRDARLGCADIALPGASERLLWRESLMDDAMAP